MISRGASSPRIDEHIVVKVPLTRDGIRACKALSREGIKVNVTLCFSPAQALSPRRSARPTSARSSAGSTTSPRPAWS